MIPTVSRLSRLTAAQVITSPEKLHPKIQPVFERLGLGLPSDMKVINKGDQTPDKVPVHMTISQQHIIDRHHVQYFAKYGHPLAAKFLSFYTDKPLPPLMIYSNSVSSLDGSKAVVRLRAQQRMRRAFCVALATSGYNWLGVGVSKKFSTKGTQLYGTVRLRANAPKKIVLIDFRKLVSHFRGVIKEGIAPALSQKIEDKETTEPPPEEEPQASPPVEELNHYLISDNLDKRLEGS